MKKTLITMAFITSSMYADLSMDQIRHMVKKIHDKREGISTETLKNTKEPFVRLEQTDENTTAFVLPIQDEETFTLHGIMNKSAYINDAWRVVDDSIGGFVLKYIGERGVVLKKDEQLKKLFLHEENDSFITIKEGK